MLETRGVHDKISRTTFRLLLYPPACLPTLFDVTLWNWNTWKFFFIFLLLISTLVLRCDPKNEWKCLFYDILRSSGFLQNKKSGLLFCQYRFLSIFTTANDINMLYPCIKTEIRSGSSFAVDTQVRQTLLSGGFEPPSLLVRLPPGLKADTKRNTVCCLSFSLSQNIRNLIFDNYVIFLWLKVVILHQEQLKNPIQREICGRISAWAELLQIRNVCPRIIMIRYFVNIEEIMSFGLKKTH